jgi:hypothetical protein
VFAPPFAAGQLCRTRGARPRAGPCRRRDEKEGIPILYLVRMTHTPENCPAYDPTHMPEFLNGLEKLEGLARELKIKVHQQLWAAPEHVAFLVLEADGLGQVAQYVNAIPLRQKFRVTPVQNMSDRIVTGKAMAARGGKK